MTITVDSIIVQPTFFTYSIAYNYVCIIVALDIDAAFIKFFVRQCFGVLKSNLVAYRFLSTIGGHIYIPQPNTNKSKNTFFIYLKYYCCGKCRKIF